MDRKTTLCADVAQINIAHQTKLSKHNHLALVKSSVYTISSDEPLAFRLWRLEIANRGSLVSIRAKS